MIIEGVQDHEWLGGPAISIILGVALVACLITILVMRMKSVSKYIIGGMGFAAVMLAVLLAGGGLYGVYVDHGHFIDAETNEHYYPEDLGSQRKALKNYYGVEYRFHRYAPSLYLSDDGKYYESCQTTISKVDSNHFKVEAECDGNKLPVPKSKD